MHKNTSILKNEEGSVIVIALMILVLLTLIGTSATQTSNVELRIVRNDIIYREHFYSAEGAAMQGIQRIENGTPDQLRDITDDDWITQMDLEDDILVNVDLTDPAQNWWLISEVYEGDNVAAFTVIDETGVIDLTAETNLHTYTILGTYELNNHINQGQVLIALGYKKRF
jgi:hypothetical protein